MGDRLLKSDHNLFYAKGIAIIAMGGFSGAYHICPTLQNFQFDTVFMFFLCGVSFVSLYRRRHGAYFIRPVGFFLAFCFIVIVNHFGIWMRLNDLDALYWVLYWPFFFVCSVLFALKYLYYKEPDIFALLGKVARALCRPKDTPLPPELNATTRRIWLVSLTWIAMIVANAAAVPMQVISSDLFLYMSFMMLWIYFCYYLMMKLVRKQAPFTQERVFSYVVVYAVLAVLTMGVGLVGFLSNATRKELPLHWSRTLNSPCWLLIFGSHDIWHFASAFTVVFQSLALYHLDDGAPTMSKALVF